MIGIVNYIILNGLSLRLINNNSSLVSSSFQHLVLLSLHHLSLYTITIFFGAGFLSASSCGSVLFLRVVLCIVIVIIMIIVCNICSLVECLREEAVKIRTFFDSKTRDYHTVYHSVVIGVGKTKNNCKESRREKIQFFVQKKSF